ncbi:4Fe-4S binding protein [Methanohalophilus sp.]|uniref:4Fe-4S binding protein n=1 Tax=Methanohalophilus sp. TaxID=1966352 RepID=UPI0026057C09|nr:4Fe-4S binding protein [Methanohalophilus sp.]MDK2892908.1 L-aspartate semialdehyde sulfurtransferase ferredoxin [Methanohalophilus sp.]
MMIKVNISADIVGEPIIAESIIETGTILNISQAHFDSNHGEIIAEVEMSQFPKIRDALISRGAEVAILDNPIMRDEEECVECGACISVCPVKVFSFDREWNLQIDADKCIQCGTCLKMCPHNALILEV